MSTLRKEKNLLLLALDPKETRVREDAFFCTRTRGGYNLTIAVVIPPINLMKEDSVVRNLEALFQRKQNLPDLFMKNTKIIHGLKEDQTRPVLAVRYFINNNGEPKGEYVFITKARAIWIDHDDHDEVSMCKNAYQAIKLIHSNHIHGKILEEKSKRWDRFDPSSDQLLSNWLCDLFSFTCRATCLSGLIPHYHTGKRAEIIISNPNKGRFHRPMRDVLALINLLNLYNTLTGNYDSVLHEKDIVSALGGMCKVSC